MRIHLKHLAKASHSVKQMLAIIIFIIIVGVKQMNGWMDELVCGRWSWHLWFIPHLKFCNPIQFPQKFISENFLFENISPVPAICVLDAI